MHSRVRLYRSGFKKCASLQSYIEGREATVLAAKDASSSDCQACRDPPLFPPLQESREALELYAAALRSGALDRTIALGPEAMAVTALVALHHLGAALDETASVPGLIAGQGAGTSAPNSTSGPVHIDGDGRERPGAGSSGRAEAEKLRWVQGLVRGWLWSVAQGRCDAVSEGVVTDRASSPLTGAACGVYIGNPLRRKTADCVRFVVY